MGRASEFQGCQRAKGATVGVPARSRVPSRRTTFWHVRRATFSALILFVFIRAVALVRRPAGGLPASAATVQRVVDGDTLILTKGERVRLLGIDAPETVHPDRPVEPWGLEASRYAKELVEGKVVRLEFDRERVDGYGRVLAYVWKEDRFVNAEIVRAGLARTDIRRPLRTDRKRLLEGAEKEARDAKRGLWSNAAPVAPPSG